MQAPYLQGEAFLRDVKAHPLGCRIWWLGQSGFLVQCDGRYLLLDPYLSDSLTRKYATTDKPHVRMTGCVVSPEQLDFVDVAVSTHNHTDHLDAETLIPLMEVNPELTLVIPEANRAFVADRLGCDLVWPVGLWDGESVAVGGFTFTGIPSAHEALDTDRAGRHHYLGYMIECGRWTIYHPGDTLWYNGLTERLRKWSIDVALLPINGRDPARRVAGNLNGSQAAQLAHEAGLRWVIPCHYDMFEFNTASPDAFVTQAEKLGQRYRVLRNGEGFSLS